MTSGTEKGGRVKIGIQTWGSTGDCRPMFVLAKRLKEAGHEVKMAVTCLAGHGFEYEAKSLGIDWIGAPKDMALTESDFSRTFGEARNDLFLVYRLLKHGYFPFETQMMQASEELAEKSDVLVQHFLCHTLRVAAIKRNLPCVSVHFWPGSLSTENSSPNPMPNLGPYWNKLFWQGAHRVLNLMFQKRFKKMAKLHGVSMAKFWPDWWTSRDLTLLASSQELWPRESDWPKWFHMAGFWDEEVESENLPDDLNEFLSRGEKPILFSFGSMGYLDAEKKQQFMEEVMKSLPYRFLAQLCTKDGEVGSSDHKIYRFSRLPHTRLFPHCRAMIHHGGAGTTHSSVKAGVPSLVVSFCEEQFSWGMKLHEQGCGPKPLRYRGLKRQVILRAIHELIKTNSYIDTANAVSLRMRVESGFDEAILKILSLAR